MTALEQFSERLKTLRGPIPIKDLAKRAGLGLSALYKAEGGHETVAWRTVEEAYGDLCGTDECYASLLALWATTQSRRPVKMEAVRRGVNQVAEAAEKTMRQELMVVREAMEEMGVPEQRDFANFSKHYAASRFTRDMAKVWMRSAEGMVREMGKEYRDR